MELSHDINILKVRDKNMCTITATEFKNNLGKYLDLSKNEEILITKYGKPISKLTPINSDSWDDFVNEWDNVPRFEVDESDPRIAQILRK